MPATANKIMLLAFCTEAIGNTGSSQRKTANTPIFTIIPLNTIVIAVGDCSYASGCQVCKGKMGILIAKAIKNNQNRYDCRLSFRFAW